MSFHLFGHEAIAPSHLRVLVAVCELWRRDGVVTVRGLAAHLGYGRNTGWVQAVLGRLRAAGLVTWERDKAATIRPTCAVEVLR